MSRRPLLLRALLVIAIAPAHAWTLGAICSGVNSSSSTTLARDMLRGKHLKVLDLVWAPFAQIDESASKGWRGLDIDLLDHFSWLLGFTYEVHNMGYPLDGETWTKLVVRAQHDGDLVASWWTQSGERRDKAIQLKGHLDLSPVLTSTLATASGDSLDSNSIFKWADPFSPSLWVLVLCLVLCSGLADWFLERHREGSKLTASLYEYAAGMLWGGFDYPLSRVSAVYQIVCGFICMVLVASYTANLAAFITLSAQPSLRASSVDQMLVDKLNLCTLPGGWQTRFAAMYPRMPSIDIEGENTAAEALLSGEQCDAMLTPKNNYDSWRTDAKYCQFEVAETLWAEQGGWMTNRQSECVQWAFEWALLELDNNGTVDAIYRNYMPVAPCTTEASVQKQTFEESDTEVRRRLTVTRDASLGSATHRVQSGRRGRRLKGSAGSSSGTDGGDSETIQMKPFDFVGIFLIWGIVTVLVMLAHENPLQLLRKLGCGASKSPAVAPEIADGDGDGVADIDEGQVGKDPSICGINPFVSANNETAMLHEVMRQLGVLQGNIKGVERVSVKNTVMTEDDRLQAKEAMEARQKRNLTVLKHYGSVSTLAMLAASSRTAWPGETGGESMSVAPTTADA